MDATERLAGKEAAPASRAPTVAPPEPVDDLDPPDEDDDSLGDDGDLDDEISAAAAPADDRAPVLAERRCRTRTCLRKFQPVHHKQMYCNTCRGLRVNESAGTPKSTSWWTKTTSREDFQQRARSREDEMRNSKEKRHVPDQILGEGKR